jgi:3-oxoacyl-[acyl-carrier-protein] synthase-3
MKPISLVATAAYVPETVIDNAFFGGDNRATSGMFKGSRERRHVRPGESSASMIERATTSLRARVGADELRDLDLVITNVSCPDQPFTGCGASASRLLGVRPKRVVDMHNTGCVSFVFMLELARDLVQAGVVKNALLCCVQNASGRVFAHEDNRKRPQSAVPGDGCGVGYVVANDSAPVRAIVSHAYPDYADDMRMACDDESRPWWEPRRAPIYIDFTEDRVAKIVARGNKLVPEVVSESCRAAEMKPADLDLLVTNQPNATFLRNWREALLLPKEKHLDSFEDYGNLFGAAIPINLAKAADDGRLVRGSRVALAGFSHAGDYAAAAIWQPG